MNRVYKYKLAMDGSQELTMPEGAEVLCVQVRYDVPYIWSLVDTEQQMVGRVFRIFGTGLDIPPGESLEYIGSFQLFDGSFVGHLFEKGVE